MDSTGKQKSILVFDGNCGFCTRFIDWLNNKDKNKLIEYIPSQILGDFGLKIINDPQKSVILLASGCEMIGGRAIFKYFDIILDSSTFSKIYNFPFMDILVENTYNFIAKNRKFFPGVTPWCQANSY